MSKFLVGEEALQALYDAGLIPDPRYCRRLVIDLEVGKAARIIYERLADDVLLDVLKGGSLQVVETEEEAGRVGKLRLAEEAE